MRLLSFSLPTDSTPRYGVVSADDDGVVDLAPHIEGIDDLGALIQAERLGEAAAFMDRPADHALDDIVFERLLPWPRKIFCIGVNYGGRSAEYADPSDAAYPSVFVRYPDSFTGHQRALVRPPESERLDYEGEIVAVIGRAGRRIPRTEALDHLAGLSLGNEGTIRDWVRHAKFNVTQGKNWTSTGSIGPWLVTMDEIGDLEAFNQLELRTHVNGELRQSDSPATMKYQLDYQIHYLSTFNELKPGDVIFTGTPTGAGARMDPPVWLKPGDEVAVSVPQIGTLRNTVTDEFDDGRQVDPPEAQ